MSSVTDQTQVAALFDQILSGHGSVALDQNFPFYPLDSPGMALPGPDFVAQAVSMGDTAPAIVGTQSTGHLDTYGNCLHYLYRRALYDPAFTLNVVTKNRTTVASFVPGHMWGYDTNMPGACGPRPASVMIIGKNPGFEEVRERRNFVGPSSQELYTALETLGIRDDDTAEWYITNLCKFPAQGASGNDMAKSHVKDCALLLGQELRLVRPQFILCLGSDASKALLGTPYGVESMVGRVMDYQFSVHGRGQDEELHTAKVMTAIHPAAVHRTPERMDDLVQQLGLFWQLINGGEVGTAERDIDHGCVYTEWHLKQLVDQALADPDPHANVIALDAEWQGQYPTDPGAYLRTIQFSYKDKWARCVVLRDVGGTPIFQPSPEAAITQLKRLCKSTPERQVRIGGHFLRADMPWFLHAGLDIRAEYAPSPDVNDRTHGGWDTSLGYHAYNETARYKLEDAATRLTTAPRYDADLQKWKKAYCARHSLKADDLEGYGECPGHILYPYGCYDADVTRRIIMRLIGPDGMVFNDWNGNDAWVPYWISHSASLAFLEMELTGFVVDRDRADEIARAFMLTVDRLVAELRDEIKWPTFNPGSSPQRVALLFGDQYSNKRDAVGNQISIRPAGAVTLNLQPVKSTGKRSKLWADLMARGTAGDHTPSTDKEVLGILGHANPIARKLRDIGFVSQVLRSVLRRPAQDDEGIYMEDEGGNYVYEAGLLGSINADGRVRTHLQQVKETGRAASSRPPLQNLSKRREDDYRRILGDLHKRPIRSILTVPPGYVGIEADLQVAEMAVLGWQCQDPVLIEHVRRGSLPEDHPDFYDIHSRQACKAFNLSCAPTKKGLKEAGCPGLRVAAKNVNFGIPYGRGGDAIARQCAEEGVTVSATQCEEMIAAYFDTYRLTAPFLAECRTRSQDPGWICGPYGRFRRFVRSYDRQVVGDQERQAQNFTIQNGVADAISIALRNLYYYRFQFDPRELWYDIMMQIHDAVILLVPVQHAERVYNEVLPACMTQGVEFWPRYLDGRRIEHVTQPYRFGIDREVFTHWGEKLTVDEAVSIGVPEWMGVKPKVKDVASIAVAA